MNYIQPGEFYTLPIAIQKIFMDWKFDKWEIGNRLEDSSGEYVIVSYCDDYPPCGEVFGLFGVNETSCIKTRSVEKYKWVPYLTETDLRRFIESKTNYLVSPNYTSGGYIIWLTHKDTQVLSYRERIITPYDDLLKTYWFVACKIAKGELINNVT